MKHPLLEGDGEIELLVNQPRHQELDKYEDWQIDTILFSPKDSSTFIANKSLADIDNIISVWLKNLTIEQWNKIYSQRSLHGILLPKEWIKVWRLILKEPKLRSAEIATKGGAKIGTYSHLWNMWSEECIEKYTNELDKELLEMVDAGYLYGEIGDTLLSTYGDKFWKRRKKESKTTTKQVVNNYLYWKIPNKIARAELTEICMIELKKFKKK